MIFIAEHVSDPDIPSFTFEDMDEFDAKRGVYDGEQFTFMLDGYSTDFEELVGMACAEGSISPEEAFNIVDEFENDWAADVRLVALNELGIVWDYAFLSDHWDNIVLFQGTMLEYAEEYAQDTMDIPEHLQYYINYDAIALDLESQYNVLEFWYGGDWVVDGSGV